MLAYITTSKHKICLVVLDYAGLCSHGNLVKSFLENHPNIEKVVVDLFGSQNKFVLLDSFDIIRDPSKFAHCRDKLLNRSCNETFPIIRSQYIFIVNQVFNLLINVLYYTMLLLFKLNFIATVG